MSRTTLSIDTPILDEIKQIQQAEGTSLGQVVTQLLAEALVHRNEMSEEPTRLEWISRPMGSLVDLSDRDAVFAVLKADRPWGNVNRAAAVSVGGDC